MKTIKKFKVSLLAVTVLSVFVLTSCQKENLVDSQTENLTTPTEAIQTRASGPSANGQGTITLGEETTRHFSFHAKEKNNGAVSGNGVLTYTAGQLKIHFDINCLAVDGNTATLTGVITKYADAPERVGWNCWFKVTDNGEGNNADADQMTLFLSNPELEDCGFDYGLELLDIEGGNIQVKN
ncbi:hypothetical protein ATE92_2789 [Ulvibacter sp. MAR_2010_11]|uniref:hypothetical protein n=1 Tax=Ulvibacter sp. MAR_2010_11 TaxID=1250229 RepID=UPI000C2BD6CC|nr:hypothetical protein [Ulvibacter sp. MAR_2010_11]PKA84591.1 hypothetical protein ATE92_2789 [Ulvibacter sp. MAR_2010_11]